MTATIQGKSVAGVVVGGDTFVPDTGWVPLAIPEGVSGTVFFRDNGNGTGSLIGAMSSTIHTEFLAITPPYNYQFTSLGWHNPMLVSQSSSDSMFGFSHGTAFGVKPTIKNGSLYLYGNGNNSITTLTVCFTQSTTVWGNEATAEPAIIGIKKI